MAKRTDVHRPGAIIPGDYSYVFSYNLSSTFNGFPVPSLNVNCQLGPVERRTGHGTSCCILGLKAAGVKFAATGNTGKCSVCGANFVYGDVWVHEATGEHIHIGHDCAAKYELIANRVDYELELGRARVGAAAEAWKTRKAEIRAAFLDGFEGLAADLTLSHAILRDLDVKLTQYGSLSAAQVALARKLANEIRNPKPAEVLVAAPVGKTVIKGTVVSVKEYESDFGTSWKWTVKVTTPEGNWLAWGTVPDGILGNGPLKGATVQFTATLKPGRDAHFAIASRPRLATVVAEASQEVAA